MADWEDVRRVALSLPEAEERLSREHRQWRVKDKLFVWERPLRRSDLEALGDAAPGGPILGVRVESLAEKEALLQAEPGACFTTPHFNGYPAVLVQLDLVADELLEELVIDAWVARAPKRMADAFVAAQRDSG
jgi:hypothetical protein